MTDATVISMAELTVRIVKAVTGRGPGIGETAEDYLASMRKVPGGGEEMVRSAEDAARAALDYINECVRGGAKLDLGERKAMN